LRRFLIIRSNLIFIATTTTLPTQCTSATVINDPTRNVNYAAGVQCDTNTLGSSSGWFRFQGSGGTIIANYNVGGNQCNTVNTGYYAGSYPSTVGGSVTGAVCYTYPYGACVVTRPLTVTNCNGYYVYYITLPAPNCDLAVCTM